MAFDSINFWFFFIPFWIIYWLSPSRLRNVQLLSISLFFYGWWDVRFLIPLILSTVTDFFVGLKLKKENDEKKRKILLGLSLFCNLGLLVVFKYLRGAIQFGPFLDLALPIGISFYTFQTLSYTIDHYNRKIKATSNFVDFAVYVSFFPQLVAGPIERARKLLPQIIEVKKLKSHHLQLFIFLACLGMAKKMFLSPLVSSHADLMWSYGQGNVLLLFLGGILTTLQVYLDFSAYSDLARALAASLGYYIMINFKPFIFSTNPAQFWQSWHISLTTWIRDYLIIPTRNRNWSKFSKRIHLIFAMCLVGIWHDLTWNWFFFGLFHGLVIVGYLVIQPNIPRLPKALAYGGGLLFMIIVYSVSGILHASYYFKGDIQAQFQQLNISWPPFWAHLKSICYNVSPGLVPLFIYESFQHFKNDYDYILRTNIFVQAFFLSLCLAAVFFFDRSTGNGFIYFDF